MKKLFIVLLSIGSYFNAFSQEKGSFELGIVGGYNGATVTANTATNSTLVSGFNAGIFGDYFFSDRWSIKGKLSYDQKGWGNGYFTTTFNDQNYQQDFNFDHVDYHLDYLTIPIMANWHFGRKRNWYLNFGPYAGFLLSADQTATQYPELKEYFNKIDAGLAFGIGVKIPISSKVKILFELDAQAGVTDIGKGNQSAVIRNSRSSYNTGLVFDL